MKKQDFNKMGAIHYDWNKNDKIEARVQVMVGLRSKNSF